MKEYNFTFNDGLGEDLFVYIWTPDFIDFNKKESITRIGEIKSEEINNKIKGVFQISHGMAEHALRYKDFANFLTDKGYIVFANDHRGHYRTAGTIDKQGIFNSLSIKELKNNFVFEKFTKSLETQFKFNINKMFYNLTKNLESAHNISFDFYRFVEDIENGWDIVLYDMLLLNLIIKSIFRNMEVILFGHSMGSLLCRSYVIKYNFLYKHIYDKIVLTGTSADPGFLGKIGLLITKTIILLNKGKKESPLLNTMSFGKFNTFFKPNRTEFDWLSRDEKEVDKYIKDQWCGFVAKGLFFYDLLKGVFYANNLKNICKTPDALKIFLLSGGSDPVGDMGKGVKKVYDNYLKCGVKDVSLKLYPEARHEILNETNKMEVYNDIIQWVLQ